MNPLSIFVRRPVATILLTVALILGGVLGYMTLPVADMPNVDFPVIQVQARQSGGSPEEIASSVAAPLERHLGAIAGLTEMTSQSSANQARITLQFSLDRDINGAARDVEAAFRQPMPTCPPRCGRTRATSRPTPTARGHDPGANFTHPYRLATV